jgi:hypothetical protein
MFRLGPTASLETLWAEDGTVFLGGAISHGSISLLATPYNGYLVVIQRLIGDAGAAVPLPDAATTMNLVAALFVAVSGLVVWITAAAHIRNGFLRGLLVALVVLSPVAGVEAVLSGTNVGWYMTIAVFWLLLWRPRATWSACLGGGFILLTGLSGPTTFFFTPLALLRAIAIRDRRDAILVGSFAAALAIQLPVTIANEVTPAEQRLFTHDIWTVFLQRVVDGTALGMELGASAWESWGWAFLVPVTVALGVYMLALVVRAGGGRLLAALAVLTAVGMFLISIYQRAVAAIMVWPGGTHNEFGGRYAMVPSLLLLSALFVLLDRQRWSPRVWRSVVGATGVVLAIALATSLQTTERGGPHWRSALDAAAARCRAEPAAEAKVHVTPEGWAVYLPCEDLGGSAARASVAAR